MKTAAKPEACYTQTPLDPKPMPSTGFPLSPVRKLFLPLTSTSFPRGGGRWQSLFCFCLLEIINPEGSLARVFLLSAVFCFICFLSQTETRALVVGFRPDPLAPGNWSEDRSLQVPDKRGDSALFHPPQNVFLKCPPPQHLGAPV